MLIIYFLLYRLPYYSKFLCIPNQIQTYMYMYTLTIAVYSYYYSYDCSAVLQKVVPNRPSLIFNHYSFYYRLPHYNNFCAFPIKHKHTCMYYLQLCIASFDHIPQCYYKRMGLCSCHHPLFFHLHSQLKSVCLYTTKENLKVSHLQLHS